MKFYKIIFWIGLVVLLLMLGLHLAIRNHGYTEFTYDSLFYILPVIFITVGALGYSAPKKKIRNKPYLFFLFNFIFYSI